MARTDRLAPHMAALADRYLAEQLAIPFGEYLDTVDRCCPTERHIVDFLVSDMTLRGLVDASPDTFYRIWQEASPVQRKGIVIEAKLLLKARAEGGHEGYQKVRDHVAAMIGVGISGRRCIEKRRSRIVGAHFGSTRGKFRGRFVKEAIEARSEEVLTELACYYSLIDETTVTSEQLRREAREA